MRAWGRRDEEKMVGALEEMGNQGRLGLLRAIETTKSPQAIRGRLVETTAGSSCPLGAAMAAELPDP